MVNMLYRLLMPMACVGRAQITLSLSNIGRQTLITRSWLRPMAASMVTATRTNSANYSASSLEKAFSRFEEKCQRSERVDEKDFVRTFDYMTRTVSAMEKANKLDDDTRVSLSLSAAILLRCCGKLMVETPEKFRELLAGNLWQFLKEKNIPLDISHYNSLLRVLNENQTNYDPQKILEEIQAAKLNPDRVTYQRLIHQYCLQGDIAGATKLLEKMKELQLELNELTFASLLIGYCKQDEPPSISEMFELMHTNNVEPGSRTIAAALTSIATLAMNKPDKFKTEIEFLNNAIKTEELQFGTYEIVEIFKSLTPLRGNDTVKEILDYLSRSLGKSVLARNRIISNLLQQNQVDYASEMYWDGRPSKAAIESGNVGAIYIKSLAKYKNVPVDFAIKECSRLREVGYNSKPFHVYYYSAAESGNLDGARAAIKKIAEDEPIKCQYYWPLLAQSKDTDEIIQVLKNDLNPRINSNDLLDTFSQWVWPKVGDQYAKVFEANKELGYDLNTLVSSFLNHAMQENTMTDALKFISSSDALSAPDGQPPKETDGIAQDDDGYINEDFAGDDRRRRTVGRNDRSSMIGRMLDHIAEETKDPEMVQKAFNICKATGQEVNNRVIGPLVKVHILNEDYNKAFEVFHELAQNYKTVACNKLLMQHCLMKKDPENLQKIMNVLSELNGEQNALFDLAICCIDCGKFKQAQKIFSSPGFRVRPERVYRAARDFARAKEPAALENFVNMSRGMYDVNQEYLYQLLINAYDRTSNGRRALNLWNTMQEEDFQPSKRSLMMIAQVLEKNNIQVPFQKPKLSLREAGASMH